MLSKKQILALFEKLNTALKQEGEIGEIGLVGGAVMCLVYNAREATRDVDAVFEPKSVMRKLAARIGEEQGLPSDWLNDAAKGFLQPGFEKQEVLNLSHLRVWAPEPLYMLAMKCISARWDTSDKDDVIFLVKLTGLKKPEEVFTIIENYYPRDIIPAKTKFFIEELLESI
jgi:hypothetical protein